MPNSPGGAGRLLGALGLGLGLAAVYFAFDPARHPFPRCPWQWLTGLYCPGCGSQRAFHALLHGHVGRAAGLNLLAVAYAPVLAAGGADGAVAWLTGRPRRLALLYRPWLGWGTVGLTLAFAVLRNLPGPAGAWLAP
ncbi:DUF2752 domain-containing protein [Hymenobacter caeli]|uniref:DUF2752 domain-containing protein n=1 Tax=Hymenobacter caeli TaxID=2735894 RepID=A0ABX2FN82_9BACT|nr:DUF2752 domain-containing protein [Hymenobacter caeli]NRT18630.1 hypothetical protein [Hymenobacter caeli]